LAIGREPLKADVDILAEEGAVPLMFWPRKAPLRKSNWTTAKPPGVLDLRAASNSILLPMRVSFIWTTNVPSAFVVT